MNRVSVDLSEILGANAAIAQEIFPMVADAVEKTAYRGATIWKHYLKHSKLSDYDIINYQDSLSVKRVTPFEYLIEASYKFAPEIENGRPARDLKRMLQTSHKTRRAKDGSKYLVIPFRHNTPGHEALAPAMPQPVYDAAKELPASRITGMGSRISATGHKVSQARYHWGGSLDASALPKLKSHHTTSIYDGMVRFTTSSGKSKSSAYMTFRVMSEKSSGWIVAAKPGLKIVDKVSVGLQPMLEQAVSGAVTLKSLRVPA